MTDEEEFSLISGNLPSVTIYSDGGSRNAPVFCGGYGSIMVCGRNVLFSYGGHHNTTNNYEELSAVLASLRQLTQPCRILVVSDSRYVCDGINKGWLSGWVMNGWKTSQGKPVQNRELWEQIWYYCQHHLISCQWIKGHNLTADKSNQTCDHLATIGMFKAANMAVPAHLIASSRA